MNLISVIVPVYNTEKYISECIDSVINQKYKNWELILVDDGSTDSSGKICDSYSLSDSRIKVFHKKNGGVSSARNYGIRVSKGNLITFLDSDDWINNDFLENGIKHIDDNDIYIAGSIIKKEGYDDINLTLPHTICEFTDNLYSKDLISLIEYNYFSTCYSKIYKKRIIGKNLFDESMCFGEDLDFIFRIFEMGVRIYADDYSGYNYRRGHVSLTWIFNDTKCKSIVKTYSILFSAINNGILIDDKAECKKYSEFVKRRWLKDTNVYISTVLHSDFSLLNKIRLINIISTNPKSNKKNKKTLIPILNYVKTKIKRILHF